MKLYRVNFENNKPVSAAPVSFKDQNKIAGADIMLENKEIKWLMILGLDEKDSISVAAEIANEISEDLA